jgi:hypothetical protein
MADVAEVVRKEIARFFAESFGDADEILEVQPALTRLQSPIHSHSFHAGPPATCPPSPP